MVRTKKFPIIVADPLICHGKPTFKGTRIMVATVLELLEAGESYPSIKAGYPAITPQHLQAALHFAHETIQRGRAETFRAARHAVSH